MKKLMQKVTGVALATLMAASSAGLGVFAAEDGADKIVNIGVTDSLGGVNPLMMARGAGSGAEFPADAGGFCDD